MNKKLTILVISVVALTLFLLLRWALNDDAEQQSKNRVPTVSQQLLQAQQSATAAKDSADKAYETLRQVQAAVEKLKGRDADGDLKEGRPETSGVGMIVSFTIGMSSSPSTNYFMFTQRDGFTKKFSPLCGDQIIPAGKPMILNFHWASYSSDHVGCYQIDSFTIMQQ